MCYRNRLHVRLKQASFAIEAYFIQSRSNLPLPKRVFLSIFITKFCILVNLESSNENREFWASRILYFLFLIKRIPYSCTTIKLQSYDYIGYSRTTVELQLYNYRGYSRTTKGYIVVQLKGVWLYDYRGLPLGSADVLTAVGRPADQAQQSC